jgi:hypothetical protein
MGTPRHGIAPGVPSITPTTPDGMAELNNRLLQEELRRAETASLNELLNLPAYASAATLFARARGRRPRQS